MKAATLMGAGLGLALVAATVGCGSGNGTSSTPGTAGASGGTSGAAAGTGGTNAAGGAGTTGNAGRGGNAGGGAGGAATTGNAGRGGSAGGGAGTTGAAGSTGGAPMPSAGCGMTPAATADMTYMIDVSGTSRSYIVSLPAGYDANQPHQLVFAWHGRTGTAMQIAQGRFYNLKQRMTNAIFVAGQGLGTSTDPADTGWPNTNGQDIAFVRAMLAWMNANYCIDQTRVFSVGFSYGGIMSHTIACQMSDTFRAVAPMAGAIFGRPTCQTHPIAAWMTHGNMDTSASGGVDFTAGESARDRIVALNHCTGTTVPVDPSPCVAYQGCDAGYPVQWCEHDGAHVIPSFAAAAVATFFLQF